MFNFKTAFESVLSSYGCLMLNIPEYSWTPTRAILDFGKKIPPEHLHENGLETTPHVTVRYGFQNVMPGEFANLFRKFGPIKIRLGKVSLFSTEKFNVLKIDVESADLQKANVLAGNVGIIPGETNKVYKPHITIAYLKKDYFAEEFVGYDHFDGMEVTLDQITYSDENGSETKIFMV